MCFRCREKYHHTAPFFVHDGEDVCCQCHQEIEDDKRIAADEAAEKAADNEPALNPAESVNSPANVAILKRRMTKVLKGGL